MQKKGLINGKVCDILDVINLTEETNFDLIKTGSKQLHIIFDESNREGKHFSFEVVSDSSLGILSFLYSMLDSKGIC